MTGSGGPRLGFVIPSSNVVVEAVVPELLRGDGEGLSAHFARFRAMRLDVDADTVESFDPRYMVEAASQLADAEVAAISYCGVSGAWLGIDRDRRFCQEVEERHGVPATTSSLAVLRALRARGISEFALVKAGSAAIADMVREFFATEELVCVHATVVAARENVEVSAVGPEAIRAAVEEAARRAESVVIMGTNLRAAPLVHELESELGVIVVESLVATVDELRRLAGAHTASVP